MKTKEARETLKKAIMSAATLIQDDPDLGEDTLDWLQSDIHAASVALDWLGEEVAGKTQPTGRKTNA